MTDDELIAGVRRTMDSGAVGRPVPLRLIEHAERSLRFELPPLVRRLYTEIGDGGFGPGYGFLPLLDDEHGDPNESAVGLYLSARRDDPEDAAWGWPIGLLPICDWGCAIRSCVDCTQPQGPISVCDPGARSIGDPMNGAFLSTHTSVDAFLWAWISDVDIWAQMFEPDETRTVRFRNPFLGQDTFLTPRRLKK